MFSGVLSNLHYGGEGKGNVIPDTAALSADNSDDKKKKKHYSVGHEKKDNATVKFLELDCDFRKLQDARSQMAANHEKWLKAFEEEGKLPEALNYGLEDEFANNPARNKREEEIHHLNEQISHHGRLHYSFNRQHHLLTAIMGEKQEFDSAETEKILLAEQHRVQTVLPELRKKAQEQIDIFTKARAEADEARNTIPLSEWTTDREDAEKKLKPALDKLRSASGQLQQATIDLEKAQLDQQALNEVKAIIADKIMKTPPDRRKSELTETTNKIASQRLEHQQNLENLAEKQDKLLTKQREEMDKQLTIERKLQQKVPLDKAERDYLKPYLQRLFDKELSSNQADQQAFKNALETVKTGKIDELRIDTTKPENKWPDNFMVATASGQRHPSWGNLYLDNVLKNLSRTKSLPEAIRLTEKEEAMIHETEKDGKPNGKAYQVPVSSTQTVDGWQLGDTDAPKRKILYIQGQYKNDEERLQDEGRFALFQTEMLKRYGKNLEIVRLQQPTVKAVEEAIDKMAETADNKTEVMIVMNGHGGAGGREAGLMPEDGIKEGSQVGNFWLRKAGTKEKPEDEHLDETQLKKFCQRLSGCKSGLLLINACHAGAWIAKDDRYPSSIDLF